MPDLEQLHYTIRYALSRRAVLKWPLTRLLPPRFNLLPEGGEERKETVGEGRAGKEAYCKLQGVILFG